MFDSRISRRMVAIENNRAHAAAQPVNYGPYEPMDDVDWLASIT